MRSPEPNTEEGATRRSPWASIITSTPVVLTVVATILAGLSSSEMTQAQYHRALAAQNQSKAGDQWNFFQAKRLRGSYLDGTLTLLQTLGEPGPADTVGLRTALQQLFRQLDLIGMEARQLEQVLDRARSDQGTARQTVSELTQLLSSERAKQARAAGEKLAHDLGEPAVRETIVQIQTKKLPPVPSHPVQDSLLQEALKRVREHQPDSGTLELMKPLHEAQIREAIEHAEADIQSADSVDVPIRQILRPLDAQLQQVLEWLPALQQAVRTLDAALLSSPSGKGPSSSDVQLAITSLVRSAAAVKATAGELRNGFQAISYGYTVQRYQREAELNLHAALLYEVQVRWSGFHSERHRQRSLLFFIGMLGAQAGVTIASLSLAVKHKSTFWALAALMGIAAVFFSAYVYLTA
jgi:hypothetical protein